MVHVPFETAATVAAAISDVLDPEDAEDTIVIAWAGDGGTYDIGIQALSSVAEQNRNILYICNNNGAYMNTGVQRSSATPWGAKTATTPGGSILWKKNMPEIMAAHRIPYVGVGSFGWKNRLEAMIIKAGQIYGCRYMDLNFPCPTGAKFPPDSAALIARLEAETGLFPLYEIVNGEIVIETMWPRPDAKLRPAEECLKLQGRFSHLQPGDIRVIQIQKRVIEERIALIKRAGLEPPDFSYLLNKED
jgi:pyruvate/2-oxoacid:ferredoxin oxidoreductase beta subunit